MKKTGISLSPTSRLKHSPFDNFQDYGKNKAVFKTNKRKTEKNLLPIDHQKKKIVSPDETYTMKSVKILQDLSPRDVSYLKDKARSPMPMLKDLPVDLEDIKKNFSNTKSDYFSSSLLSVKNDPSDEMIRTLAQFNSFSFDKLTFGLPSGRQVSENLKKWLEHMKSNFCGNDEFGENAVLIHKFCCNELIRQISVSCIEQGKILQEILEFYSNFSSKLLKKTENLEEIIEESKKYFETSAVEKEKKHSDYSKESQKKIEDLQEKLSNKKAKNSKLKIRVSKLEKLLDQFKKTIYYDTKEKSYTRKGTAFHRPRGLYESISPGIGRRGEFEKPFDLEKTVKFTRNTQTEKTELKIESWNEFNLCDIELREEDIQIDPEFEKKQEDEKIPNLGESLISETSQVDSNISYVKQSPDNKSKIKTQKIKGRFLQKKELQTKQFELEKKISQKKTELQEITKKIKVKVSELDFLTQTIKYKKAKDIFQSQPDNLEKINDIKPANLKNFNILSDPDYWGDGLESGANSSLRKSLTQNLNFNDDSLLPKAASKLITIRPASPDGSKSNNSLIESSSISEEDPVPVIDRNFSKKSCQPLEDLPNKIDPLLVERENKGKKSQPLKIIERLCEKDIDWIKSKSGLHRRLLNKLIFSLYINFYSRHSFKEDFLDYVYYDFYQRYGLKFVSDKKFVEFICSLAIREDSKKYMIFLKIIGAGTILGKVNYSQTSFQMYLEGLSFLINSKIGLSINDDYTEKFTIPLIRGIELAKQQLDPIDKNLLQKVLSLLESKSTPDPKRFNPNGLIDGETVLETIIEGYESLKFKYLSGVEVIVNALKYDEPKDLILKTEVIIIMRQICPKEIEHFEGCFDDKDFISLEQLCHYAVNKRVFAAADVLALYKDEGQTVEHVQQVINSSLNEMKKIISDLDNIEKFMKTLNRQVWEKKIANLVKGVPERKPSESVFAFRVFLSELMRIQSTFL